MPNEENKIKSEFERIFRNLPSVNQLVESPPLKNLVEKLNHNLVVDGVRDFLDNMRDQISTQISTTTQDFNVPTANELAETISSWLVHQQRPILCPVINATGVILHTGLGRAPLSRQALTAMGEISKGYASVELDLNTGERGQRMVAVAGLLKELTHAEAALVVNNNAAATVITLATMATGRDVIVSRGELVEIGGSYRLPDVMSTSGAILREVGTTNRTRVSDYQHAIQEHTAALMKVHPSNFKVMGFTESVDINQLVALGRKNHIPVIDDIGSGALMDLSSFGLTGEPLVADSVRAGADVILFSGDKLLGGPQCGIIVGKQKYIDRILAHPLMRAMRVDKLTLAALAETLKLYRHPETAQQEIPVLRMISQPLENLRLRANKISQLIGHLPGIEHCEVVDDHSMLGGGSVPTQQLPTYCVAITFKQGSLNRWAKRLRSSKTPLITRITRDRLLLDPRTIFPEQDQMVVAAFETACHEKVDVNELDMNEAAATDHDESEAPSTGEHYQI